MLWYFYNDSGEYFAVEDFDWIPAIGVRYHMGVDGLSFALSRLDHLADHSLAVVLGPDYSQTSQRIFCLFLLLENGYAGRFCVPGPDSLLFLLGNRLVPMFSAHRDLGPTQRPAPVLGYQVLYLYLVGSVAMLLAFIGIYLATNTWQMTEIPSKAPFANDLTWRRLLSGHLWLPLPSKYPLWPFHTWLPDAHTAAPRPGSVILRVSC